MPCAECLTKTCLSGEGEWPLLCPMTDGGERGVSGTDAVAYESSCKHREEDFRRLDEVLRYAKERGCRRIGLACCIGLHDEARVLTKALTREHFEVSSVMCKTGSLPKSALGVPAGHRIASWTGYGLGYVACNPVAQALVLNEEKTDLNLIVGLCVGHDSIFIKYSEAPVATLIAKDRSNGHNPAAILYTYYGDTFFGRRPKPKDSVRSSLAHASPRDLFGLIRRRKGRGG